MKVIKNVIFGFVFLWIVGESFLMGTQYASAKGKYPTLYNETSIIMPNTLEKVAKKEDGYLYFTTKKVARMKFCVLSYTKVSQYYNSKKQYLKFKNKYDFSYYSNKGLCYAAKSTNEEIVSDDSGEASPDESGEVSPDPEETTPQPITDLELNVAKTKEYTQDLRTIIFIIGCLLSLMYGSILGLYFKRPKGI